MKRALLLLVILGGNAFASDRHFWKDNRTAIAVDAGAWTADTIVTCYTLSRGWHENFIPTQKCGVIAAWSAGSWGLATGVSYLLHRTGHYHLSKYVPLVDTSFSVYGLGSTAYSATQPRRKQMYITASWSFAQPVLVARPIRVEGAK